MSISFDRLLVRKFDDGRYEYIAKDDAKPEGRNATFIAVDSRIETAEPAWTFEPRRSDLPESEWAEIKRIAKLKSGKWARFVNCYSWWVVRNGEGRWTLCP